MKKCIASQQNILKYKKGFTLIEALVAIFILTVSVTGLLGVVSQSVFNSNYTKNKAIAIGLAQEGVELVRNIQDTNLLQAGDGQYTDFDAFNQSVFSFCGATGGACTISSDDNLTITGCPIVGQQPECGNLYLSPDGHYSNDSIGNNITPFTRSISIVPTGPNSGRATVTVSWDQGSLTRSVVYETELFMWIQ